jgi:hypothetical protein
MKIASDNTCTVLEYGNCQPAPFFRGGGPCFARFFGEILRGGPFPLCFPCVPRRQKHGILYGPASRQTAMGKQELGATSHDYSITQRSVRVGNSRCRQLLDAQATFISPRWVPSSRICWVLAIQTTMTTTTTATATTSPPSKVCSSKWRTCRRRSGTRSSGMPSCNGLRTIRRRRPCSVTRRSHLVSAGWTVRPFAAQHVLPFGFSRRRPLHIFFHADHSSNYSY